MGAPEASGGYVDFADRGVSVFGGWVIISRLCDACGCVSKSVFLVTVFVCQCECIRGLVCVYVYVACVCVCVAVSVFVMRVCILACAYMHVVFLCLCLYPLCQQWTCVCVCVYVAHRSKGQMYTPYTEYYHN